MTLTEKRFREGSGERYMPNGEVRCQAQAKGQLRRWREEHQDFTSSNEDIWPECQCAQAAVPGMFTCHWHGGATPSKGKPKSILDVLPLDLSEKFQVLMENPDYISRREEMLLMKARYWENLEEIQNTIGSEEAWGMVHDALVSMKQGKLVDAEKELEQALEQTINKREAWKEIREVVKVLDALTSTEVKSAKELKLMASVDQVARILDGLQAAINRGIDKYVRLDYIEGLGNARVQAEFKRYIAGEIYRLTNVSPATLSEFLAAGSEP